MPALSFTVGAAIACGAPLWCEPPENAVTEPAHWAFIAPRAPDVAGDPAGGPVDHFLRQELRRQGLHPAPAAAKHVLLRRATADLTGMPPTAEEITAFLADDSPLAFERVVDRLLASSRYGIRWARHWLDLVRYSDDIEEAWRYRDWVIKSFNDDLPYDRFVESQIAGDLFPPSQPGGVNADGIVATTMLTLGNWGGIDPEKRLMDIVDDQIDMVGRTFLGLTLSCARCHDHKLDPISSADYYSLAGIFLSSRVLPDPAYMAHSPRRLRIPLVPRHEVEAHRRHQARVDDLERRLQRSVEKRYAAAAAADLARTDRYLTAAWEYQHPAPDGPRPGREAFAAARGLKELALSQWIDYLAAPRLTSYRLLAELDPRYNGVEGIHVWKTAAERPWWGVNTTTQDAAIETFTLPARSLSIYPSPDGAAVGWRSPLQNTVRISGRLADADPFDGAGVVWVLDLVAGGSRRELAAGTVPNGGSRTLAQAVSPDALENVAVKTGDEICLHVWLNNSDAHYDITQVELEIAAHDGSSQWSLTRDALDGFLEGNPHRDSKGNAAVWSFYDGTGSHRSGRMPSVDVRLQAWDRIASQAASPAAALVAIQELAAALQDELGDPDSPLVAELTGPSSPFRPRQRDDAKHLTAEDRAALELEAQALATLRSQTPPFPCANGVEEGGLRFSLYPGFQDARVHPGGSPASPGAAVARGFPTALAAALEPAAIRAGSGRRELGKWLSSAANPLTARVMVNRIWQHLFGEGIVRSPSDFGRSGDRPGHPELLDFLAVTFERSGWSVKAMHRLILLSSAYQQSSVPSARALGADPDNRLFGRMNRKRLDAEAIHDGLLFAAGRLDERMGGPPDGDPDSRRRMVYRSVSRGGRTGIAALFDGADPLIHVDKRTISTTSPQALFFLNNPRLLATASSILKRQELAAEVDAEKRINGIYTLLLGRPATRDEAALGRAFLHRDMDGAGDAPAGSGPAGASGWEAYTQAILLTNELVFLD